MGESPRIAVSSSPQKVADQRHKKKNQEDEE
jgi:hypothetical protein